MSPLMDSLINFSRDISSLQRSELPIPSGLRPRYFDRPNRPKWNENPNSGFINQIFRTGSLFLKGREKMQQPDSVQLPKIVVTHGIRPSCTNGPAPLLSIGRGEARNSPNISMPAHSRLPLAGVFPPVAGRSSKIFISQVSPPIPPHLVSVAV